VCRDLEQVLHAQLLHSAFDVVEWSRDALLNCGSPESNIKYSHIVQLFKQVCVVESRSKEVTLDYSLDEVVCWFVEAVWLSCNCSN